MSLSIGGFHPEYVHAAPMGVTSQATDLYAQYTAAGAGACPPHMYQEYTDNSYVHNWVLNSSHDVSMSPESYGTTCSTPSPDPLNAAYQQNLNFDAGSLKYWGDNLNFSQMGQYENSYYTETYGRGTKRRTSSNKKERRRTVSINGAFSNLRGSIPNVPSDTKLSKIKTLRLAISYISYLNEVLEKEDSDLAETGFKADISRKRERRNVDLIEQEKKRAASVDSDDSGVSSGTDPKVKGRTGWPQHVWASELKTSPK